MGKRRFVTLVALMLSVVATALPGQTPRNPTDKNGEKISRVLGWLPDDTETVVVAQQPFVIEKDSADTEPDAAKGARGYILDLLSIADSGKLIESSYGRKLRFAVLVGRRFTTHPEAFLGLIAYQGCAAYAFESSIGAVAYSRPADTTILGYQIWISTGKQYGTKRGSTTPDDTFLRTVLGPDTLLICNDRDFLYTVLSRAAGAARTPKFEELPEWTHVDHSAPVWGVRHFVLSTARLDPTSPAYTALLDSPDLKAIGVTMQVGSPPGKVIGRWLTKSKRNPWKTLPEAGDFEGAATVRQVSNGVFELVVEDRPSPGDFGVLILMAMLGFAIAL